MSRKIISEYFADEGPRKATVFKEIELNEYSATSVDDMGSAFTAVFENLSDAEDWAESWVMNK